MNDDEGSRTTRLRATSGPKVVANAARYFTNDLYGIAVELLQNARRAGAAQVAITLDPTTGTIAITDDGRGLSSEGAHLLLSFGGSENPEVVEYDERAAGMGFFSLARRGATVRSRDWRLVAPPGAFTGEVEAELETGLPGVAGLEVAFGGTAMGDAAAIRAAVDDLTRAAQPMPFATTIDGAGVERIVAADWLRTEAGEPLFDDIVDRRVGDCLVTVARFEDGRRRWARARPARGRFDAGSRNAWLAFVFDLFGQVIGPDADRDLGLHPVLPFVAEEPIIVREREGGGRWIEVEPGYLVVVEALGSETVVPRLPDRTRLVETDGLKAVGGAAASLVAALASRAPRNGVRPDSPLRALAAAEGRLIPQGQRVAYALPRRDDEGRRLPGRPMVIRENGAETFRDPGAVGAIGIGAPGPTALAILANAGRTLRDRLVCCPQDMPGTDRLVRAAVVHELGELVVATGADLDDDAVLVAIGDLADRLGPVTRLESLELVLETASGARHASALDHVVVGVAMKSRGAFISTYAPVLTTPRARLDAIVEDLVAALFEPDDGSGATEDEQLHDFRHAVRERALEFLDTTARIVAESVRDAVVRALSGGIGDFVAVRSVRTTIDARTEAVRIHVVMTDGSRASVDIPP